MSLPKYGQPVMPEPVRNPRVAYESWLAINFVPAEYHPELTMRLNAIQEQAVHMVAEELRKAGCNEAADLIDSEVSCSSGCNCACHTADPSPCDDCSGVSDSGV